MELKEAIEKRQSIRKFSPKKFDVGIIEKLLYYANLAPSAGNLQARDFIVVDDDEKKRELAIASYNQLFISEAPYVVVFCANYRRIAIYGERGKFYSIQDVACAVENFLLTALEDGLATCWVGAFDENRVRQILNLPEWVKPVAIVPVGYAGEHPPKTERFNIKKLIHYNEW